MESRFQPLAGYTLARYVPVSVSPLFIMLTYDLVLTIVYAILYT